MANKSLYKIFDKLHKNMTREEIVEVLYDLVELKINTNSFKRPISDIKLVIGERMAPAFFHDYPKSAFLHPFSIDNRIFLPESDIEDALQTDNVGKLIRTIGHELEHVYQTSWGVTTRMIGALIMVHSDDFGLVLPPNIAPTKVAIIPIGDSDEVNTLVDETYNKLIEKYYDEFYPITINNVK